MTRFSRTKRPSVVNRNIRDCRHSHSQWQCCPFRRFVTATIGIEFNKLVLVAAIIGLVSNSFSLAQQDAGGLEPVENLWTRKKGEDWPGFLGIGRDCRSTETGILKDWTDGKLKQVWTTSIGQGYCGGAVSQGRFYQFDAIDGQAQMRCLNAETGGLIWEFKYPSNYKDLYDYDSGPRSSPLVDGQYIYCFGVEGMLHCLSVRDGSVIWKIDTAIEFGVIQNFFGVGSSPVIYRDHLFVMIGGSPAEDRKIPAGQLDRVSPNGSAIVAINKRNGKIQSRLGNDLASYSSIKLAEIGGKTIGLACGARI